MRRHAVLAAALEERWTQTAAAFGAGAVNLAQTRVITEALQALPADLGEDLLAKAETLLVTQAAKLGPRELKVFGSTVLEYLAPDIAEEAEYHRLLAQEKRSQAATKLFFRPRGEVDDLGASHRPGAGRPCLPKVGYWRSRCFECSCGGADGMVKRPRLQRRPAKSRSSQTV